MTINIQYMEVKSFRFACGFMVYRLKAQVIFIKFLQDINSNSNIVEPIDTKSINNNYYLEILDFIGGIMKLFNRFKKKVEEVTSEEINCDVCGVTLKSYQKSEHKKLCEECFSKINED